MPNPKVETVHTATKTVRVYKSRPDRVMMSVRYTDPQLHTVGGAALELTQLELTELINALEHFQEI